MIVIYCKKCGAVIAQYIGLTLDEVKRKHSRPRHNAWCGGMVGYLKITLPKNAIKD